MPPRKSPSPANDARNSAGGAARADGANGGKSATKPAGSKAASDKADDKATLARLAEMQRLETIGRLTGGVAHDFNNILTVVIGNTELLLENLAPGDASRPLAEVTLAAARSGADLIRMLLAYSRQQPISPVEFNANDLIEEMLDLLLRSLGAQVKIETELDAGLWGIRADRAQLGSVLLNLAVNARDALREGAAINTRDSAAINTRDSADNTGDPIAGAGTLRIATANMTLDKATAAALKLVAGDYVTIAVADSGAGIAPEALKRVFEPFFTTKAAGRGNGLGLSMVQGFVRQSGGQVRIDSAPGTGTTVRLYLPRAQIQLDLPNIGTSDEIRPARAGETVLVVEDNERVRGYVVERLRRLGYGVIATADSKQAFKQLQQPERVDLLFSDIDMPGLDGVKLAERARRLKPGLRILFTSAHPDARDPNAASEPDQRFRHGQRLLLKPYRKQELARMVRTTLDELL